MVNPIIVAGCLAIGLGGLAFAFVGGDLASRQAPRRGRQNRCESVRSVRPCRQNRAQEANRRRSPRYRKEGKAAHKSERPYRASRTIDYKTAIPDRKRCARRISRRCGLHRIEESAARPSGWRDRRSRLTPLVLARLRVRRINKFIANFPTAIDIIVRGIKAGLPLGDTIRIAAAESPAPVNSEFRKVVESLSVGMTIPEAVERMAERVPITETNFFSIVITIQGKSGGNLSEALGNLSRVLRERKKMKGKIIAMSMEAKASAAVIGAVPFLVVGALYLSSPHYISPLWTTSHGRMITAIAICWMAIGVAMMKKMVAFDF